MYTVYIGIFDIKLNTHIEMITCEKLIANVKFALLHNYD